MVGVAVEDIVAISVIEAVVPTASGAIHAETIAAECIITSKAVERLTGSLAVQRAVSEITEQGVGT